MIQEHCRLARGRSTFNQRKKSSSKTRPPVVASLVDRRVRKHRVEKDLIGNLIFPRRGLSRFDRESKVLDEVVGGQRLEIRSRHPRDQPVHRIDILGGRLGDRPLDLGPVVARSLERGANIGILPDICRHLLLRKEQQRRDDAEQKGEDSK